MKQFKKILIVITALVLLVTSFVVVIGAEEKEKGTVEQLNRYIALVEIAINKGDSAVTEQVKAVSNAYTYIRNSEIDWTEASATPEYAAAVLTLEGYSVQVAGTYSDSIEMPAAGAMKDIWAKAARSFNKVYDFAISCAASETTAGYAEMWAKLNAKNESVTEGLYSVIQPFPAEGASGAAKTLKEIREEILNLYDQTSKFPLQNEELNKKYSEKAFALLEILLADYEKLLADTAGSTSGTDYTKRIDGITLIQTFVYYTDVTKADGYSDDIAAKIAKYVADAAAEKEAKRNTLDESAPLAEYAYDVFMNRTYNSNLSKEEYDKLSVDAKAKYDADIADFSYPNKAGEHQVYRQFEDMTGEENGYLHFNYGEYPADKVADGIHHYAMIGLSSYTSKSDYGFVFEWDMRINEAPNSLRLEAIAKNSSGTRVMVDLLGFKDSNGKLTVYNYHSKTSIGAQDKNKIDPNHTREEAVEVLSYGSWNHFTITYNPETRIGSFYLNYEKMFDIYYHSMVYEIVEFWFTPTRVENWDGWDFDNAYMYYGTEFRITDKFDKMDDEQEFEYFVNVAANNESENYLARNAAYDRAKRLVGNFVNSTNPKMIALVEKFNAINYETDIKLNAMKQNLGLLNDKIEGLKAIGNVNTGNTDAVNTSIESIMKFLDRNSVLIDKTDKLVVYTDAGGNVVPGYEVKDDNGAVTKVIPGYQSLMSYVYSVEAEVKKLEIVKQFVDAVKKFERATTLSSLTRYALAAEEIYKLAEYDIKENRDFVISKNDPYVEDFEMRHNKQTTDGVNFLKPTDEGYIAKTDPRFEDIFEYYDFFAVRIAAREKLENSKNIVNAISRIKKMNNYESTVEFWEANFEQLESYTILIRGYINEDKYDTSYEGVEEALEEFYKMDVYFFERLQLKHIETLEEMIAKYDQVNTYIEKKAIVSSIKAYFENEDTALNNEKIKKAVRMQVEDEAEALTAILTRNEVYSKQLEGLSVSYSDVLTQQTQYFINIINHIDSLIVFSEIEALFEEATVYYYGINLNVEGALEAADKYVEIRSYIASVKESNRAFELYMDELDAAYMYEGAEMRDMIFKALQGCKQYVDSIDASDMKMAGLLEMYNAELETYESNVSAIESAIYEAVQFTNALRTTKLPVTVLSVIGRLVNN